MKKLFQIFFYSVVSMKMQEGKTVVSMCDTMPGDHDRVTLVIIMDRISNHSHAHCFSNISDGRRRSGETMLKHGIKI